MIKLLIKKFLKLFDNVKNKEAEEYLSKATDHTDLERRIKKLENENLKGWI